MFMQVHRAADRTRSAAGSILVAGLVFLAAFLMGTGTARAAQREASVRIPVACEAAGISERFQYSLWDSQGQLMLPQLLLQDGDEDWFTLTFTSPGRYAYTVTQEKGTDTGVTYDDTRFQAVVYVENAQNGLQAQLILCREGGGDKLLKLTFVNKKKDPGTNGSGDGSGNGGSGDSNGPGSGPDNGGSGNGSTNGNGSGSGSGNDNGSGSFWGNGSFWGSTSGNGGSTGSWGSTLVRTGDSAPLAVWGITALAAIVLAAGLLLYKRNNGMRTDRKDREDG